MTKKEREYKRLPGRGIKKAVFSVSAIFLRLYLGKDHLLCVESQFASENYRRFYYQDIQAITTRKSVRGKAWNIALLILSLIFILINIKWGRQNTDVAIIYWIITGIFLFFLLINWMRGPTCVCHLITPIHTEELPSLNRLRTARKAIRLLTPLIEQAQGRFSKEEMEMKAREFSQSNLQVTPAKTPPSGKQQKITEYYNSGIHTILYCLLLLCGGLFFYQAFYRSVAVGFLISAISIAVSILVIIALVRQHGSVTSSGIKRNTWITLAYLIVNGIYIYINYIVLVIKNPKIAEDQWELIKLFYCSSAFDSPFFLGYYIFVISGSFILGLIGIGLITKFKRAYKTPPPLPDEL